MPDARKHRLLCEWRPLEAISPISNFPDKNFLFTEGGVGLSQG